MTPGLRPFTKRGWKDTKWSYGFYLNTTLSVSSGYTEKKMEISQGCAFVFRFFAVMKLAVEEVLSYPLVCQLTFLLLGLASVFLLTAVRLRDTVEQMLHKELVCADANDRVKSLQR